MVPKGRLELPLSRKRRIKSEMYDAESIDGAVPVPISECIIYQGPRSRDGYGICGHKNKKVIWAHRKAYEDFYGEIPDGMIIRHLCDNPLCINPKHLAAGTHADNVMDRVKHGRSAEGERNGRSKLTVKQVRFILSHPEISGAELARKYGVWKHVIYRIRSGSIWACAR